MKTLWLLLALALIAIVVALALIYTRRADNIGLWREDLEMTARASVSDNIVTLKNVRDYTYTLGTVNTRAWFDTSINTKEIVRAWFYLEPFPAWDQVGHTFLSFELADGTAYAFSVEAKIEQGDTYSALRGLFNEYELALQWGLERDFVSRRILLLETNLYRYPLKLTSEEAQALFVALALETEAVATTPRFYNTLTENCTNILSEIVNSWQPGTLPLDLSWFLTGRSDEYLLKEGFLEVPTNDILLLRDASNLAQHKDEVLRLATSTPSDFTQYLNTLSR